MMYYDDGDLAYISRRLDETIVNTVEGVPVYINGIRPSEEGLRADCVFLKNGKGVVIDLQDLDLSPVSLGWVNGVMDAAYMVRKPIRDCWKQGTTGGNITYIGPSDFRPNLRSAAVHRTIVGEYPTLKAALAKTKMKKDVKKIAFSRHFAVGEEHLFYKGFPVGQFTHEPYLFPKYNHLAETLADTLAKEAHK